MRPVPMAVQPFSSKDLRIALPRRPEAPVTRTVLFGEDMARRTTRVICRLGDH